MKLKSFATLVENEGNSRSLANQSFNGCGWVGELLFSLFVLAHNPQLFLFYTKPREAGGNESLKLLLFLKPTTAILNCNLLFSAAGCSGRRH